MEHSPLGSSVHEILQGRILEWAAVPSSRRSFPPGINPISLKSPALADGFFLFFKVLVPPVSQETVSLILLLLLLLSHFSRVRLCATPETPAHQAPLSMGFSRQECWSGVPLPSLQPDSNIY